jgi:hypothetical protein
MDLMNFLFSSIRNSHQADFIALVRGFDKGEINICILNYVMIILVAKEEEAKTLKKYIPISLINCSFKIFSKVLNMRLETICGRPLAPNQTTLHG